MADTDSSTENWKVYIIESSDGKLYTGITTDMEKRWLSHSTGKGAKFFRSRSPKVLRFLEDQHTRSSASKREADIKKLSRKEKLELIQSKQPPPALSLNH